MKEEKIMTDTKDKADCYKCKHKQSIPGDCHLRCKNSNATVAGVEHGIKNGWFCWPANFDPTWLVSCDGFAPNK